MQLTIQREDIAYVVAERLLRKDDEQLAWIANHLRRFAPLYPGLTERLNDFARLFPIHPAYIDIFDRLFIAEKRQALGDVPRRGAKLAGPPRAGGRAGHPGLRSLLGPHTR